MYNVQVEQCNPDPDPTNETFSCLLIVLPDCYI